jgi:hypothetical protein
MKDKKFDPNRKENSYGDLIKNRRAHLDEIPLFRCSNLVG